MLASSAMASSRSAAFSTLRTVAPRRPACIRTRLFSSSPIARKYLPPAFEPTASTELDAILDTLRRKVILPRLLNTEQKKLVRDPSKKDYLTTEEVIARIGEEDIRLEPFNYSTDGVNARETLRDAIQLAVEHDEFDFIPHVLQGLKSAGVNINHQRWNAFDANGRNQMYQIVRRTLDAGHINLVLRMVNRAEKTNVLLNSVTVRLIATAIRNEAFFAEQVILAEHRIEDSATRKTIVESIRAVAAGEEDPVANKSIEQLQIRAEALSKGFKQATNLNRLVSQTPVHSQQNLSKSDFIYDPILTALPLELKAELELTEGALQASGVSSASPAGSTTGSPENQDEATPEETEDSTIAAEETQQELDITALPLNAPTALALTNSLLVSLNRSDSLFSLIPAPDSVPKDFPFAKTFTNARVLAVSQTLQTLAYHERYTIIDRALGSASKALAASHSSEARDLLEQVGKEKQRVQQELVSLQAEIKAIQESHLQAKSMYKGYFSNGFQEGDKAFKLTVLRQRAEELLSSEE